MKRFLCAAFFIALVALLAACGVLNKVSAPVQATATPTSSTSRSQQNDTVTVKEAPATVDVVSGSKSRILSC